MNPELFLADLAEKPDRLRSWDREADWGFGIPRPEILLLGMGSSHYANLIGAARLRAAGFRATAELASSDVLPAIGPDTRVIAVSASAGSAETIGAVERLGVPFTAVANQPGRLTELAQNIVWMAAGAERGGVACRSFQHTLVLLLDLAHHLAKTPRPPVSRAADAAAFLLDTQDTWLPRLSESLLGPDGTAIVAPARRLSSAQQSALMLREGPRRPAVGCETGDWSHVDVYLTKTTDYRMALFAGSVWERQLLEWTRERGSTVVGIGADIPGAAHCLRYRHDEDDDVRLLTETLVIELIAARTWAEHGEYRQERRD